MGRGPARAGSRVIVLPGGSGGALSIFSQRRVAQMYWQGLWGTTPQVSGAPMCQRSGTEWSAWVGATNRQMPPVGCREPTPSCAVAVWRLCAPGWYIGRPPGAPLDDCSHTWVATLPLPPLGFQYGVRHGAMSPAFSNPTHLPPPHLPTSPPQQATGKGHEHGHMKQLVGKMSQCASVL